MAALPRPHRERGVPCGDCGLAAGMRCRAHAAAAPRLLASAGGPHHRRPPEAGSDSKPGTLAPHSPQDFAQIPWRFTRS